jgi:hypothetical protein
MLFMPSIVAPTVIPPIVGLTFSLLGGLFVTCTKFLVFDFPISYRALRNKLHQTISVGRINLDRDADKLKILQNAENGHYDRLLFFHSIVNNKLKVTEETKELAWTHLSSLSDQQGRLEALGNVGSVPFENCQDALLKVIDSHRARLFEITDCGDIWNVGDEWRLQEYNFKVSCEAIHEALKVLEAQFDIAHLAASKEVDDIKAETFGLRCKFWAAVVAVVVLGIAAGVWLFHAI